MSANFQQTVNLKDRMGKSRTVGMPKTAPSPNQKKEPAKPADASLDEVYRNAEADVKAQPDLRTISRPQPPRRGQNPLVRWIGAVLALIVILTGAYFIFFKNNSGNPEANTAAAEARWYAVKLTNGEVYYGQIGDIKADPVEVRNVYYNYDQLNAGAETSESGNLRLVKRGQETHGPEGVMDVVRSQVVYMEPLKEDSKVLKAILDYEQ